MPQPAKSPEAMATVLTPPGRGAIAVIRVAGRRAVEVVDQAFRPARARSMAATEPGRLRFGRIGAGLGDEVVVVALPDGPNLAVEIHCHGGLAAIELVLDALVETGATRGTVETPDSVEAQALALLPHARTLRTAEILLEQAQGALEREAKAALRLSQSEKIRALDDLILRGSVGLRLVRGWTVALAGRPNVGKSRLLNALAGYSRAIVSATPGTTRDILSVTTAFEGWPVVLGDTAGLRAADDPIEQAGVASARRFHGEADLTLLVLDRSEPLTDTDLLIKSQYPSALCVASKADLPPDWTPDDPATVTVSAERGEGIEELAQQIVARLVPAAPPPGAGVPFTEFQVLRLEGARQAIQKGRPDVAARLVESLGAGPVTPLRGGSGSV